MNPKDFEIVTQEIADAIQKVMTVNEVSLEAQVRDKWRRFKALEMDVSDEVQAFLGEVFDASETNQRLITLAAGFYYGFIPLPGDSPAISAGPPVYQSEGDISKAALSEKVSKQSKEIKDLTKERDDLKSVVNGLQIAVERLQSQGATIIVTPIGWNGKAPATWIKELIDSEDADALMGLMEDGYFDRRFSEYLETNHYCEIKK